MRSAIFIALVACSGLAHGLSTSANPVRKVVSMLQSMQKRVEAEGEKETAMYNKFQCWCKTGGGALAKSIADAGDKIPQVAADIKEAESQIEQLKADVKQAKSDREAAKAAVAEATAIREKEAASFAKEKSELDSTILAIEKAVEAISKGMAGAFLQSSGAHTLTNLAQSTQVLVEADREELLAFLSNTQGYAPQSGQILGILKQMGDSMAARLEEATKAEDAAIKAFDEFVDAKTKEIQELTDSIESKMARIAELGVRIVEMKQDLSDTEAGALADKKFLADLDKNCAKAKDLYDANMKTRAEELLALADTIKLLNDDDALELFKKTLPSASASFVQVQTTASTLRARALAALPKSRLPQLDLISMALRGKKVSFDAVIKMIDEMTVTLKKEQSDDEAKKEYCAKEFDTSDDKKKKLEKEISDGEAAIADAEELIAKLTEDIANLEASIKALDEEVAEAGAQRKEEHAAYNELMTSDSAAKELLGIAKNRLNKFYNPSLYIAPPKRELSAEDTIVVNMGGTAPPTAPPGGIAGTGITGLSQIRAHSQSQVAPPPPPETMGAYAKKSEESGGVIAMIDLLVKDLDKEMTEAKTTEEEAQRDYIQYTQDSADKRAEDSKTLMDNGATKIDVESELESHKEKKNADSKELLATLEYIQSLHNECDWLLKYFDVRKEARSGEIEALSNAKAILSGADYSLLQTKRRSLRRV